MSSGGCVLGVMRLIRTKYPLRARCIITRENHPPSTTYCPPRLIRQVSDDVTNVTRHQSRSGNTSDVKTLVPSGHALVYSYAWAHCHSRRIWSGVFKETIRRVYLEITSKCRLVLKVVFISQYEYLEFRLDHFHLHHAATYTSP